MIAADENIDHQSQQGEESPMLSSSSQRVADGGSGCLDESNVNEMDGLTATRHVPQVGEMQKAEQRLPVDENQSAGCPPLPVDDLFEDLLNEITTMKKTVPLGAAKRVGEHVTGPFGSPEEECHRLTSVHFASAFDILRLTADATEEEIRKQYRLLSLKIHPDKCKHDKAEAAFHVVTTAYEELQISESKEKYKKVIVHAKKLALKERRKANAILKAQGKTLLPETEAELEPLVHEKCEELLTKLKEQTEYAKRTRSANEAREKRLAEELEEEERKKHEEKKQWEQRRDGRVDVWREYQASIKNKEVKLSVTAALKHKREIRSAHHVEQDVTVLTALKRKKTGMDESYKEQWR